MQSENLARFEKAVNNLCERFERICKVLNKEKRASMKNLKRIQALEKVLLK